MEMDSLMLDDDDLNDPPASLVAKWEDGRPKKTQIGVNKEANRFLCASCGKGQF